MIDLARPQKSGVDYWNIDCTFYQNKKIRLIRSEFGSNGMYLLNYVLCEIYTNGYYVKFDKDWCIFISEGAVCAGSADFVEELIKGCVRRSFFDQQMFDRFGILTSESIQRRYMRMVTKRKSVKMIREYFLLDLDDPDDVPGEIKSRIFFKSVSSPGNPVSSPENPVMNGKNPQSKGNKSIEKESTVHNGSVHLSVPCTDGYFPIDESLYQELTHTYPHLDVMSSLKKMSSYILANPDKMRNLKSVRGYIDLWLGSDHQRQQQKQSSMSPKGYQPSYDIEEYESSSVIDEMF